MVCVAPASAEDGGTMRSPTSTDVVDQGNENQPGSGSSKVALPASASTSMELGQGFSAASSAEPYLSATPLADSNTRTGGGSSSHSVPVSIWPLVSFPHAASINRMVASTSLVAAPKSTPVSASNAATDPVSGVPNVTTVLISPARLLLARPGCVAA